jgi:hypothetical protein
MLPAARMLGVCSGRYVLVMDHGDVLCWFCPYAVASFRMGGVCVPAPPSPYSQNAGAAGSPHIRSTFAAFADGRDAPAGADRPNPRDISNVVVFADDQPENERDMSTLVYIWGQVRVARLCTPPPIARLRSRAVHPAH